MRTVIDNEKKLYTVWLSNEDKQIEGLYEKLEKEACIFRSMGYLVAYFQSGGKDLVEATTDLVISHYREMIGRGVRAKAEERVKTTPDEG